MGCGQKSLDSSSDATDLCTSCGLCCGGAVFDTVPVQRAEVDDLIALGLEPYEDPPGQPRLDLPCRHLRGAMCGIYEQRPSGCRAFRCKLLQGLDDGSHTLSSAKAIVEEAKERIDRAVPLMNGSPVKPHQWRVLLNQWQEGSPAGRATEAEAKTVLALTLLNRFFDTHFRDSGQQVVKPKE